MITEANLPVRVCLRLLWMLAMCRSADPPHTTSLDPLSYLQQIPRLAPLALELDPRRRRQQLCSCFRPVVLAVASHCRAPYSCRAVLGAPRWQPKTRAQQPRQPVCLILRLNHRNAAQVRRRAFAHLRVVAFKLTHFNAVGVRPLVRPTTTARTCGCTRRSNTPMTSSQRQRA